MLEKIKSKKSLAAVVTLAFAALVTCGAMDTYAAPTATGTINMNTPASSGTSSGSSTSETSSIPDTSAGTTTENPKTADETWLYALASLAVTAAAIGGRHYFAKH